MFILLDVCLQADSLPSTYCHGTVKYRLSLTRLLLSYLAIIHHLLLCAHSSPSVPLPPIHPKKVPSSLPHNRPSLPLLKPHRILAPHILPARRLLNRQQSISQRDNSLLQSNPSATTITTQTLSSPSFASHSPTHPLLTVFRASSPADCSLTLTGNEKGERRKKSRVSLGTLVSKAAVFFSGGLSLRRGRSEIHIAVTMND